MTNVLDVLNAEELRSVLKLLCEDSEIAEKVAFIANKNICKVNIEEVAADVFDALDFLDVEDLWDSSGAQAGGGYEDPGDVAYQMVEDALEPFSKRLYEYSNLELHNEAKLYCMGILKGIMQYTKNSDSKFKDWAEDCAETCFENIFSEWKENCSNVEHIKEMDDYVLALSEVD